MGKKRMRCRLCKNTAHGHLWICHWTRRRSAAIDEDIYMDQLTVLKPDRVRRRRSVCCKKQFTDQASGEAVELQS
uniref:Uncharacterized protein n=1 Tax=Hyaloperonospora arabidopsidis (strain Emoy2) TaxID=559515 RepID=M4B304_HYAAE